MPFFLNLPNLWNHTIHGAVEGRAIILDFIGMAFVPSKLQLLVLDMFIIILQLILTTIAYETSVYYASEEADQQDLLLPDLPTTLTIPLFHPSLESHPDSPQPSPMLPTDSKTPPHIHDLPLIIDLRFNSIIGRLRNPPPPPRVSDSDPVLPLPNTTSWPLPGMRMLLSATQMRDAREGGNRRSPTTRGAATEGRIPGGMDLGAVG